MILFTTCLLIRSEYFLLWFCGLNYNSKSKIMGTTVKSSGTNFWLFWTFSPKITASASPFINPVKLHPKLFDSGCEFMLWSACSHTDGPHHGILTERVKTGSDRIAAKKKKKKPSDEAGGFEAAAHSDQQKREKTVRK